MKKPQVFITGIAGFAGQWLTDELINNGYAVAGSIYQDDPPENIKFLKGKADLYKMDILNNQLCQKILKKIKPEYIFHLAAISSVGRSYHIEKLTYQINIEGTYNIIRAALEMKNLKKFIFISSSEVYGLFSPKNKTLNENEPINPISPYAISKASAEQICLMYHDRFKLPVTIARSFNHSGPGQSADFVIPSFCKQIAEIEANKQKPTIKVGDLSPKRDLSDVRDIVRGYRLLAEKGKPGQIYHLSSGRSVTIESVLKKLLKLSSKKITVKIDKNRLRKNDIPIIRGSNNKASKDIGYECRYNIDETMRLTLNYWREKYN